MVSANWDGAHCGFDHCSGSSVWPGGGRRGDTPGRTRMDMRIFPHESKKKSFGSTYARKIEAENTSQRTIRAKSAISTFDDGGQYSSVINISQC
jgi:hypothetical protein